MEEEKVVLVSGATGYIGSHVVREFLDHGYRVRGTVRDPTKQQGLEHLHKWIANGDQLELVKADLLDAESWKEAVKGCNYVAHVASPFFVGCPDDEAEEKLFAPARQGTINVLQAALEAGTVKRVVLTSSVAAITAGHETPRVLENPEEQWTNEAKADNYSKSKTMAERAAWDFVEQAESDGKTCFELCTINPALVIGPPLSNGFATSHSIPSRILSRQMPAVPDMYFGTIDVRDVAKAHRLALETPAAAGNRFALQAQSTGFIHWAQVIAKTFRPLGYNVPTRKLPYFVLWLLSFCDPSIRAILGQVGAGPRDIVAAKAKKVLGMEFYPEETSIVDHCHACIRLGVQGFKKTKEYASAFPDS